MLDLGAVEEAHRERSSLEAVRERETYPLQYCCHALGVVEQQSGVKGTVRVGGGQTGGKGADRGVEVGG